MEKVRLDVFLSEKKLVRSRNIAKTLICSNKIMVNNSIINKPNFLVNENDLIKIIENEKYVSRGAYKLKKALDYFNIKLNNFVCVDIGTSTGGFAQVLLENNAKKIYCIDVGENQLSQELKENSKIINIEKTNFKNIKNEIFNEKIDFVTIDVSFISAKQILNKINNLMWEQIYLVLLLKPQFEIGISIKKNGYVPHEKHKKIIDDFYNWCETNGFIIKGIVDSPILGAKKENKEYLLYIKKV